MTKAEHVIALASRNGTLTPHERVALGRLLDEGKSSEQKRTMRPFTLNTDSTTQMREFLYGVAAPRSLPPPASPSRVRTKAKLETAGLFDDEDDAASPVSLDMPEALPPQRLRSCNFPPKFIKEGGRNTERLARDVDALLALLRHHPGDRRLQLCLLLSDRLTQLETLRCKLDPDGRIRYSGNITGTETQRHAIHKSNTGSGYNLHAVAGAHKHLFLADPGYVIFSVDLSSADGFTIGAECAALGDPSMLADLNAGIKPAQAVALLYQHGDCVNTWPLPQVKASCSTIDREGWLYMACKRVIWGTAYGMGEQKMASQITEDSYGIDGVAIYVEPSVCRALQTLVHGRYPGLRRRQQRIDMLLERDGALDCANGSRRVFLGPPTSHETRKEAYGHHPQIITTWVTSLAWHRLWHDPENRSPNGDPIVQPLLLVHDSLMGQFPEERTDWALAKLRQWMTNPVTIAGTTITIPFSGEYGRSWGELTSAI